MFKFPSPAHSTQAVHGDPFQTPMMVIDTKSPNQLPASAPPTVKSLNRTVSESMVSEIMHRLLSPKNQALTFSSPSMGTTSHNSGPSGGSERSLALMDLTVNTNIPFPGFDAPEGAVWTLGAHMSPESKAMTGGSSKSPFRNNGAPPMLARASSEGTPQQSSSKSLQSSSTQKTSSSSAASSHSPFALPPQAISFPEPTVLPVNYSVFRSSQALSSAVEPSPPRITSLSSLHLPDTRTAHISPRGGLPPRSDSPLSDIESDSDMTEITTMTQETTNTYSVLTPLSARPVPNRFWVWC